MRYSCHLPSRPTVPFPPHGLPGPGPQGCVLLDDDSGVGAKRGDSITGLALGLMGGNGSVCIGNSYGASARSSLHSLPGWLDLDRTSGSGTGAQRPSLTSSEVRHGRHPRPFPFPGLGRGWARGRSYFGLPGRPSRDASSRRGARTCRTHNLFWSYLWWELGAPLRLLARHARPDGWSTLLWCNGAGGRAVPSTLMGQTSLSSLQISSSPPLPCPGSFMSAA